jgi:hypothetical protein
MSFVTVLKEVSNIYETAKSNVNQLLFASPIRPIENQQPLSETYENREG